MSPSILLPHARTRHHRRLPVLILLAGLGGSLVASAAPGIVIKKSDVYAKPFIDAATVASVREKDEVEILGASGAWSQIRTNDGKTGWIRLLNVRPKAGSGGSSIKGLLTAGNVVRTGSTGSAATTGAKGISKEDLEKAQPNLEEAKRLEGFRASPDDGRQFAASAGLRAQRVDPLPGN